MEGYVVLINAPTKVEQLYEDTLEAARLVEVPCNEALLNRVLQTYQEFFDTCPVAFRTTSHPPEKRDLSFRYTAALDTPHDPYAMALAAGLYTETGHPIEAVLPELEKRFKGLRYGIDATVRYGFNKIWPYFAGPTPVEEILSLNTIPDSMKRYVPTLKKFGMELSGLLALDYLAKTINIYYLNVHPEAFPPEKIASMIADAGFKVPSREELELNAQTVVIYYTFSWDSPNVERLSFGIPKTDATVPKHMHPVLKIVAEDIPMRTEQRQFAFCTTYGTRGDYLKIEADYFGTNGRVFGFLFTGMP
jgi:hypothetical protein